MTAHNKSHGGVLLVKTPSPANISCGKEKLVQSSSNIQC